MYCEFKEDLRVVISLFWVLPLVVPELGVFKEVEFMLVSLLGVGSVQDLR